MSGNSFCHKPNESLDSVSLKLNLKKKKKGKDYGLWCEDEGKCKNFGEDAVLRVKITFYVHYAFF